MNLQIYPMPVYIPVESGPSAPVTDAEAKVFGCLLLAIYIVWFFSFFISYFFYKRAKKKGGLQFRDYDDYITFRYSPGVFIIIDAIMVIFLIVYLLMEILL